MGQRKPAKSKRKWKPDAGIDFSEIPPLDEHFFRNAVRNPYLSKQDKNVVRSSSPASDGGEKRSSAIRSSPRHDWRGWWMVRLLINE